MSVIARIVEQLKQVHKGEEAGWPTRTDTSEAAWCGTLDQLKATQRALCDAVSKRPGGRLHENIAGKNHSCWYELLGILHHDLYHAGQISLLKGLYVS